MRRKRNKSSCLTLVTVIAWALSTGALIFAIVILSNMSIAEAIALLKGIAEWMG